MECGILHPWQKLVALQGSGRGENTKTIANYKTKLKSLEDKLGTLQKQLVSSEPDADRVGKTIDRNMFVLKMFQTF